MAPTILSNARIFTSRPEADRPFLGSLIFENGVIQYVGPSDGEEVAQTRARGANETDVQNALITPGFIDGHVHILHFGLSLDKLDLSPCKSLQEIRTRIKRWASAHPTLPRVLCKNWIQSSTNGEALASMLDDLDSRPIYIEAFDLHSVWCNTAALEELKVASMSDPDGGTIHRDSEDGRPSGLLSETAFHEIALPYLVTALSMEEKHATLLRAFTKFAEAGNTGLIDMAMDDTLWTAMDSLRQQQQGPGGLGIPFHIAAYWLIPYSESDEEIQKHLTKAIEMNKAFHPSTSPSFCVTGIKLIADGVVDGCTAALSQPYGAKQDPIEPIWPADKLARVVAQADAAGLQCAIHAIGDRAITQAIDAFAALEPTVKGQGKTLRTKRHRIEHLELATSEDATRLGKLGIIASVQPVHSDPVYLRAWPSLLGSHRCQGAFPYSAFLTAGAPTAFGTDAPTAQHFPLPNLYVATTRRSIIEPECLEETNPEGKIGLAEAVKAATKGVAYTRYADSWTGSLGVGMSADFVVLDADWDAMEKGKGEGKGLLEAKVRETWFRGVKTFDVNV